MVDEFDLPQEIIDRKVTKMKMISPSNREVDVGKTLSETEYIGMCRREILDSYLRKRAVDLGAKSINALVMRVEQACPLPFQMSLYAQCINAGQRLGCKPLGAQ